jgi:hypothetical protein
MPKWFKKLKGSVRGANEDLVNDAIDTVLRRRSTNQPSDDEQTASSLPPSASSPSFGRNQRTVSQPDLADYYNNQQKTENNPETDRKLKEDRDREAEQVARETADSRRREAVRP